MYVAGLRGVGNIDPLTGKSIKAGDSASTGKYPGTSCPAGQVVSSTSREMTASGRYQDYVTCKPAPVKKVVAPAPAAPQVNTNIAPVITVSPNLQQQFTPQVSPVFQQSSGSGSQTAGTTQEAPGGQSGAGGSSAGPGGSATGQGMTAADMLALLAAQDQARQRERAEERAYQREQETRRAENERLAQEEFERQQAEYAKRQQQLAIHSQYTGPTSAPLISPAPAPIAPKTDDSKRVYLIGGAAALALGALVIMTRGKKK